MFEVRSYAFGKCTGMQWLSHEHIFNNSNIKMKIERNDFAYKLLLGDSGYSDAVPRFEKIMQTSLSCSFQACLDVDAILSFFFHY